MSPSTADPKAGTTPRTLDEQRIEFVRGRYLAMPIAGAIVWTIVGVAGAVLPVELASWVLFIATGSTFGVGLLVARIIIPAIIVAVHLVTIVVLARRLRA